MCERQPPTAARTVTGSRITTPACAHRDRGAALSRSDSRWCKPVLALDLDQLVASGRARDDRHLRRRDAGPPRHGADHGCVGLPIGRRLAAWQEQVRCARREPDNAFEQSQLLATLTPKSRLVPLDSCNHLLPEHDPAWKHFLAEIDRFLPGDR
jgi:hypothetical protein